MFFSKNLKKNINIQHCFFSRKNGFSKGIYKSLNCGKGSKDNKKNIRKNLDFVAKKMAVERNKLRRILQDCLLKNFSQQNNHKPYWLLVNLKFGDFCNDKSRLLEEFQNLMSKSRLIK